MDWIGIAGPTAAGKSAAALAVAQHLPVEIVSVDSALVYRGMDIGTAKPTAAEQALAPHHLIDLMAPTGCYDAATFARDATRLIAEIRARGRLPLLVGGTMLYFKALIDGIDALPGADAAIRTRLDAEAAADGWPALHARLAQVDATTAARLAPTDAQRIQRALEVWELTGQPLSALHRQQPAPPVRHHLLALEPNDRVWLHARIAQRFDAMLDAGLIDEVRALRARGDLRPEMPAMRCVGYRQAWQALDAGLSGADLRADVRERGVAATRQLAKRQLTWLRSLARTVVPADGPDPMGQTVAQVVMLRGVL
ncbi:MAG: tRNA (adenosine(37)-N6)-dimethylallyltransferase MiaA [Proteobacteria bacterium]|nr:tRNA (adenosine(37)-N6)-dimethylallyltransferase MiaA [Pseudomonadota bacterium]